MRHRLCAGEKGHLGEEYCKGIVSLPQAGARASASISPMKEMYTPMTTAHKSRVLDMTRGDPFRLVLQFSLPLFCSNMLPAGLQPDRHRFGGASAWLRRSGGDRRYRRTVRADHELCLRHEQWSGIDGQPLLWGRGAGGHPPRRRLDGHPLGGGVAGADHSVAAGARCAAGRCCRSLPRCGTAQLPT